MFGFGLGFIVSDWVWDSVIKQWVLGLPTGSKVLPFWGLPYRILIINHKKELLWSLWVGSKDYGLAGETWGSEFRLEVVSGVAGRV